MINTIELEKRWLRYKTKIFRSILFILFFIFAIPYLSYYLLQQYKLIIDAEKNITSIEKKDEQLSVKNELEPKVEKNLPSPTGINEVVLAPSIPIVDFKNEKQIDMEIEKKKIEHQEAKQRRIDAHKAEKDRLKKQRAYRKKMARRRELEKQRALENKRKSLVKAKVSSSLTSSELAEINGIKTHKEESKKITFHRTSTNYMPIMKRKFEQNRNPREAVLIAKAYYKAGNYMESEKWALVANNLDKNSEDSWFIFAKSKAKLGKRREALKILVSYNKKAKSTEAKDLIQKIQDGSI